jgi:hypothetical protein
MRRLIIVFVVILVVLAALAFLAVQRATSILPPALVPGAL